MNSLQKIVTRPRLTRAAVATRLGIAPPRLNALLQGKLDQFDLDDLVTIAARAGLRVKLGIVRWSAARPPVVSTCGAHAESNPLELTFEGDFRR